MFRQPFCGDVTDLEIGFAARAGKFFGLAGKEVRNLFFVAELLLEFRHGDGLHGLVFARGRSVAVRVVCRN